MGKKGIVNGLSVAFHKSSRQCYACTFGKATRSEFQKIIEHRHCSTLDVVHSDVCGPMDTASKGGALYFVTCIDEASRWSTVYPITKQSDVLSCFKKYLSYAERKTGKKLISLQSDGGGEYISREFLSFLEEKEITARRTCAYTPQQNGIAERMSRTLLNMVRSMLKQNNVSKCFWPDAVVTATYIKNRLTCSGLFADKTPYEIWHGTKPDVSHFRVIGTKCLYHIRKEECKKLGDRAHCAITIGYSPDKKDYKLWMKPTKRLLFQEM